MSKRPKSIAQLPVSVPLFPLTGALLLPHLQRPLQVFEPRYVDMIDDVLAGNRLIGIIQPSGAEEESPKQRDVPLKSVGGLGYLAHFEELADGRYVVGLDGICRFDVVAELDAITAYRQAEISADRFASDFAETSGDGGVDRRRFMKMMRNYADFADLDMDWDEIDTTNTADLVNMCCMLSPYGAAEKQLLLEASSLKQRAETLIALAELEMAQSKSGHTLQ